MVYWPSKPLAWDKASQVNPAVFSINRLQRRSILASVLSRNTIDVRPTLGALKNLRPTHLSGLYGALLRDANLAARTVGLVHPKDLADARAG